MFQFAQIDFDVMSVGNVEYGIASIVGSKRLNMAVIRLRLSFYYETLIGNAVSIINGFEQGSNVPDLMSAG